MTRTPEQEPLRHYLEALQDGVCAALEQFEPGDDRFVERVVAGETSTSWSRMLSGETFERAAVHRTRALGEQLPRPLLERKPDLQDRGFEADSLSIIVHPRNPYVPTMHANLRCFKTTPHADQDRAPFWFGGGFDLTPCYGFEEDARHWHRVAHQACLPYGTDLYERFKRACDEYFYLPHRQETRGVGGLFFEDLESLSNDQGSDTPTEERRFEECFAFVRSVGDHLLPAYVPLVERRMSMPFSGRERSFQSFRRGRYVEFNLLYDRGTRYGLRAGRRTEAILSSLPPAAEWRYEWRPDPGSPEAELSRFLVPRDWLDDRPD